jgi:hypothetical protein
MRSAYTQEPSVLLISLSSPPYSRKGRSEENFDPKVDTKMLVLISVNIVSLLVFRQQDLSTITRNQVPVNVSI